MSFFKTVAKGLGKVAPTVANLVLPGSGALLEGVMRKVTGDYDSDIEDVAATIQNNPALMVELKKAVLDQEVRLAEIRATQLETVNKTMREEAKSEHWPQYSWRPFNGFTYPLAVLLIYFVLPMLDKVVPDVPQWIWVGWLSILGVAVWGRNKAKALAAGDQSTGMIAGVIDAIRK